jgi:hypothetical protein
MKTTFPSLRKTVAVLLLAFGLGASAVQAQIVASGQMSGTPIGGGVYDYTITLHNDPSSSSGIQTFWYSWVPGADFLPSSPMSVTPPAGWAYYISVDPYYYGYSIEFYNYYTALTPGSSLDFHFTSSDTPETLAGNSPIYLYYPIGTSWVFSGVGYGDSLQFVVESVPVPEPGTMSLLTVGLLGCWCAVRRSAVSRSRSAR